MELFYSVRRRKVNINTPEFPNLGSITKISSRNILAFTSQHDLQVSKQNNSSLLNKEIFSGDVVYVCDITAPYHIFRVTGKNKSNFSVLEWEQTGKYLLVGDTQGVVQIWAQKCNLLSEWLQVYEIKFQSEKIIHGLFFCNGKKINYSSEKREAINYLEKFSRSKFAPTVNQFGNVAAEGCVVITSTGLLGAVLFPGIIEQSNNQIFQIQPQQPNFQNFSSPYTCFPIKLEPVTQSLGLIRSQITSACLAYEPKDESFRIAVANPKANRLNKQLMIQSFKIIIKINETGILQISNHALSSFFLSDGTGKDSIDIKITHLSWMISEEQESLIVGTKSIAGASVELWSLKKRIIPINKLLQINKTEKFETDIWVNLQCYKYTASSLVGISLSKFISDQVYIFLVMKDNSIHVLTKDLRKVITTTISTTCDYGSGTPKPKLQKRESFFTSFDITFFGHLILAIDNQSQIYCIKIPQNYQEQNNTIVNHLTTYFEYAIFTGYDISDVLISIRSSFIENIVEKLTDNFLRQPSTIQQYYYVNFLRTKIMLHRMQISGQTKASDLINLLMLHSTLIAFKSLLRPSDLTNHDKGPAENLAAVLLESQLDIDKVLTNLQPKDFTVESFTVQSLQQLIQWVSDLALNILAKLPQSANQVVSNKSCNYDMSKDTVALNSIRELLVMIRIWGLLNPQCLPVFSRSVDNLDILSTLYRLITRLAINPMEPDEILLDECCLLPSQVQIPQILHRSTIVTIASPMLYLNNLPLYMYYNIEPDFLIFHEDVKPVEGSLINEGFVDSIRNLWLGKKPPSLRKCVRCGTCSIFGNICKTTAMKAWEQRWITECRCGGYWIIPKTENKN